MLSMKSITVHYGKSMAIQDVSLDVDAGKVVSIIGANGSGKSTILRALSGLQPLTAGEISFMGRRIDGRDTAHLVKLGISLVPEGRQLFPYLSVLSNLKLGASLRNDKEGINRDIEDVYRYFPVLKKRANQKAGTLSGGEQQMLAIGRGLMARPKLLMMDEPSLGLAPLVIDQLGMVIKDIKNRGISVLLVEQNVNLAFGAATRGYVLQVGRVVLDGDIEEMKARDVVRKAYLGE